MSIESAPVTDVTPVAEPDAGGTDAPPVDDDLAGGNSEAAKYRRRLRDTEQERDGLRERVERFQRAEVERIAGEHLASPADLWLFAELDGVLDDDGDVDPERVLDTVRTVSTGRPGLRVVIAPSFDGGARTPPAVKTSWSDVLR